MLRPKRLTTVIITILVIVQSTIFCILGALKYVETKNGLYQQLNDHISLTQKRLQNNLPRLLWNFNDEAIHSAINAEIDSQYIETIAIAVDNQIEYGVSQFWQQKNNEMLSDEALVIVRKATPIELHYTGNDGNGTVGGLIIISSDAAIINELKSLNIRLIQETVILNIVTGLLIFFTLYFLIIKPIRHTNNGLKEIINEGTDLSKRLDEDNIGELGELAANYNQVANYVSTVINEREASLKKANESAQLKSEFLASMSHEIRTPMNGVLGTLNLIKQGELNKQQQHYTQLALNSAQSLLVIINDILDFSKVEAGKLDIENIPFNLRDIIEETCENFAAKAQEKHIAFNMDLCNINTTQVKGDPVRIRQILNNTISNAVKFTHEGEILITAELISQDENWQFTCSILDTGIGIPEDKQHKLFTSFSQVDASTTRQYGGTGLGLAIVEQLCQLMNGRISFSSKENDGSCFSITLPLGKTQQSKPIKPNIEGLSILIVDQNKTHTRIIEKQLEHWEQIVHTQQTLEQALTIIQHNTIDIILFDSEHPELEQLVAQTTQKQVTSKKILLTPIAYTPVNNPLHDKFSDHITKPIILEDWLQILQEPEQIISNDTKNDTKKVISQELQKKHVLIVEDNLINQEVALAIIEGLGYSADIAENGLEAIDKLKQNQDTPYGLIFMDCQMPEMDGYETTKNIRKGHQPTSKLPIIAMTANAMKGDREKCISAGMDDYISKPVDPNKIQEKLNKWL